MPIFAIKFVIWSFHLDQNGFSFQLLTSQNNHHSKIALIL